MISNLNLQISLALIVTLFLNSEKPSWYSKV